MKRQKNGSKEEIDSDSEEATPERLRQLGEENRVLLGKNKTDTERIKELNEELTKVKERRMKRREEVDGQVEGVWMVIFALLNSHSIKVKEVVKKSFKKYNIFVGKLISRKNNNFSKDAFKVVRKIHGLGKEEFSLLVREIIEEVERCGVGKRVSVEDEEKLYGCFKHLLRGRNDNKRRRDFACFRNEENNGQIGNRK